MLSGNFLATKFISDGNNKPGTGKLLPGAFQCSRDLTNTLALIAGNREVAVVGWGIVLPGHCRDTIRGAGSKNGRVRVTRRDDDHAEMCHRRIERKDGHFVTTMRGGGTRKGSTHLTNQFSLAPKSAEGVNIGFQFGRNKSKSGWRSENNSIRISRISSCCRFIQRIPSFRSFRPTGSQRHGFRSNNLPSAAQDGCSSLALYPFRNRLRQRFGYAATGIKCN